MKASTSTSLLALGLHLAYASAPNPGSAWKNTLFLDDFTGPAGSLPSTKNWIFDLGTKSPSPNAPTQWGTGEIEYNTDERQNIQQNGNGYLQIFPRKSKTGNWTSARIETVLTSFEAPAGGKMRIESRLMIPDTTSTNGLGYWPSLWALGGAFRGNYNNWPKIGEIDIMETVNSEPWVNQGIHCDVAPGGVCNEPDGITQHPTCGGSSCVGQYHTYTAIVDRSTSPETISFEIDSVVANTINETTLGTTIWNQTFHHGYYVLLDIAMGGSFPNALADVTTPTSATVAGKPMMVDYVAVWTT